MIPPLPAARPEIAGGLIPAGIIQATGCNDDDVRRGRFFGKQWRSAPNAKPAAHVISAVRFNILKLRLAHEQFPGRYWYHHIGRVRAAGRSLTVATMAIDGHDRIG